MGKPGDGGQASETHPLIRPHELTFSKFRVQVTTGKDAGLQETGEASEFSIGTADANDLVLTDPTVSRYHCVINATQEGFVLRDVGSTNGTALAGYRVNFAYLRPSALISIGQSTLRFDSLDQELREPLSDEDRYGPTLGKSVAMRRIFAILPKIAAADSTILLEGETGTGKTLLASAIHEAGARAQGPFLVVDCSSIAPTLIESELFGHEKGAFTGAHVARPGVFESARTGTVFLDEIGELPIEMQPKLLRVLEERSVRRIGSSTPTRLDVRIIAATNRDLREMVNRGTFRSDLFYRVNTVRLRIPPLRERREDIPLLVAHFYDQFGGVGAPEPDLVSRMVQRPWAGNIRELRSAVERAVLLGPSDLASTLEEPDRSSSVPTGDPDVFDPALSYREAKERAMARWERWYVSELVGRNDGNLAQSARQVRMDRNHLRELLRRHRVSVRDHEDH